MLKSIASSHLFIILLFQIALFNLTQSSPCSANCDSCLGSNECIQCSAGYELTNSSTSNVLTNITCKSCNIGTYFDSNSLKCASCSSTCFSCQSLFNCTACKTNSRKTLDSTGAGICSACGPNTFLNSSINLCETCPSECINCQSTNCSACKSRYGANFECQASSSGIDEATLNVIIFSDGSAITVAILNAIVLVAYSIMEKGGSYYLSFFVYESFYFTMRYLKLSYDNNALELFQRRKSKITLKIDFGAMESYFDMKEYSIPDNFKYYGLSSRYMKNNWDMLFSLLLVFIIGHIIAMIRYKGKGSIDPHIDLIMKKIQIIFRWTYLIGIIVVCSDDILIYGYLELLNFDDTNAISGFSKFFALLMIILMVGLLIMSLFLTKKIRNERNKIVSETKESQIANLNLKYESFQLLTKGIKDLGIFSEGFFFFFLLRVILWNAAVAFLTNYPKVQSIILAEISAFYIIYLLLVRPSLSKIQNIVYLLSELLLLATTSCLILLAFKEDFSFSSNAIDIICSVFVKLAVSYPIGYLCFVIVRILSIGIPALLKAYKMRKKQNYSFKSIIKELYSPGSVDYNPVSPLFMIKISPESLPNQTQFNQTQTEEVSLIQMKKDAVRVSPMNITSPSHLFNGSISNLDSTKDNKLIPSLSEIKDNPAPRLRINIKRSTAIEPREQSNFSVFDGMSEASSPLKSPTKSPLKSPTKNKFIPSLQELKDNHITDIQSKHKTIIINATNPFSSTPQPQVEKQILTNDPRYTPSLPEMKKTPGNDDKKIYKNKSEVLGSTFQDVGGSKNNNAPFKNLRNLYHLNMGITKSFGNLDALKADGDESVQDSEIEQSIGADLGSPDLKSPDPKKIESKGIFS